MSKNLLSHAKGAINGRVYAVVVVVVAASGGGTLQGNCIHNCLSIQINHVQLFRVFLFLTNSISCTYITEEAERPADLNQPIVFKQRHKPTKTELESDKTDKSKAKQKSDKSEKRKKAKATSKLSFNEDEEDAEADED